MGCSQRRLTRTGRALLRLGRIDSKAMVWNAANSDWLFSVSHDYPVLDVAFKGDGKLLATASSDKTARVWNPETGNPLTPPLLHHRTVFSAKLVGHDNHLLTSDEQGHVRVWSLPVDPHPVEDLIRLSRLLAGDRAGMALTAGSRPFESRNQIWFKLRNKYPE